MYVSTRYGEVDVGNFTMFYKDVKLSAVGTKKHKAQIKIGEQSQIGDRTQIHAGDGVYIGNHVFIAWDVNILDRDYHAVDGLVEKVEPIYIEDNAWICCRAIILKGTRIGHHAIVGAGAVVTKDVAPYSIVAGNPAQLVGTRPEITGSSNTFVS